MKTERITVAEVEAAYEQTGISPVQCFYYDEGDNCGCPMAALYCVSKGKPELEEYDSDDISRWADQKYGFAYHEGFVTAVDNNKVDETPYQEKERYKEGYKDGLAVFEAIFRN